LSGCGWRPRGGYSVEEYARREASSHPTTESAVRELDDSSEATPAAETGPTVTAKFDDGPLHGDSMEVEVLEGRPPKTIDVPANDGGLCRYCLVGWVQTGESAVYTFLYRV